MIRDTQWMLRDMPGKPGYPYICILCASINWCYSEDAVMQCLACGCIIDKNWLKDNFPGYIWKATRSGGRKQN